MPQRFQRSSELKQVKHFKQVKSWRMSSLGPSSTDFQLFESVNLTTSIYIISSFTLKRLIKSRIEDRHSRWFLPFQLFESVNLYNININLLSSPSPKSSRPRPNPKPKAVSNPSPIGTGACTYV